MTWTILKIIGVVLVVLVAYVAWVLMRASASLDQRPTAHGEILTDSIRISVSFPGTDTGYFVSEIRLPRETGEQLGIAAPEGFTLEPYTLNDTGDPKSEDSAEWVEAANRRDIRWVGSRPLTPDGVTMIDFPVRTPARREVVFQFQYERKLGLGGQISFFSVSVAPDE